MKAYCIDTSGLSTPLEHMPEDIHRSLWEKVSNIIVAGRLAVTTEIYEELTHLNGPIGECIKKHKAALQLEVDDESWDAAGYIGHTTAFQMTYESVISENNNNRPRTIGLNDLSIIALGATLKLPVISSEKPTGPGAKWKKIPDICALEAVDHMTFNDFLRKEGIVL